MNELEKIVRKYLPQKDAEKILQTRKCYIALNPVDEETELSNSKIGGYGYLPRHVDYPINGDGKPLSLLAQLNFSELPFLENFPEKGILSFYVDYFDYLIGMDLKHRTNQKGFRVFYFPELSVDAYSLEELESYFEADKEELKKISVIAHERKLEGYIQETMTLLDTVDFTKAIKKQYYDFFEDILSDEKLDKFEDEVIDYLISPASVGGYPFFTQTDPREYDENLKKQYNTLLFQLNSDDENVMWGDYGVANFFINDEKLRKKDFSDVLYNWDCY